MSDETRYKVVVDLSTTGSFSTGLGSTSGKIGDIDSGLSRIKSGMADVAASAASAFTGIADQVVDIGIGIAKWGAAGAIGAVAYGVANLNTQLETTRMSLAAVMNANGVSDGMTASFAKAGDLMKQIRRDAAALPGETSDLVGIFRSVLIPGLRAGQNAEQLEKFSANVMAAGAASGLQMDMVAREAGMLVSGRAGAHNVLGSTLFGLTGNGAKEFNAKSAADRMAFLNREMGKYGEAIGAYSSTMDAISSTLRDNAKKFLSDATAPLFDRVKKALAGVNDWYTSNESRVHSWADKIGTWLAMAWDRGTDIVKSWYPIVREFVSKVGEEVSQLWERWEPIFAKIGTALGNALKDPDGTIAKLEGLGRLYMALKLGGPIIGALGEASSALGSAVGAGGGAVGSLVGGAVVGAAAVEVAGAAHAVTDETSADHAEAVKALGIATHQFNSALTELGNAGSHLSGIFWEFADKLGTSLLKEVAGLAAIFNGLSIAVSYATTYLTALWRAGDNAANQAQDAYDSKAHVDRSMDLSGAIMSIAGRAEQAKERKPVSGGGGTHIQKVEIIVHQDGDPNRVARAAVDILADMQRYPKSSRHVPNYSSSAR